MDGVPLRVVSLVDFEASVGDIGGPEESKHVLEYASAFFTCHLRIILLAANERTGMNTMFAIDAYVLKGVLKAIYIFAYVSVLVMENHA